MTPLAIACLMNQACAVRALLKGKANLTTGDKVKVEQVSLAWAFKGLAETAAMAVCTRLMIMAYAHSSFKDLLV